MKKIALEYSSYDLSIIPVIVKSKRPTIEWGRFQDHIMHGNEIDSHFKNGNGIAIICGAVSGGLEILDFDNKNGNAKRIFEDWKEDKYVKPILNNYNFILESTQSGGFHLVYRYDNEGGIGGNQKLASQEGNCIIETRGEGGYFICSPSPGYNLINGSFDKIPTIQFFEREVLIEAAKSFNDELKKQSSNEIENVVNFPLMGTNPVDWFNWNRQAYAKKLLTENGWSKVSKDVKQGIEYWKRPGKEDGHSATWGYRDNVFHVFTSTEVVPFEQDGNYTPFMIVTLLRFEGDYEQCMNFVKTKYQCEMEINQPSESEVIRVNDDYYQIHKGDLIPRKKAEVQMDYGNDYLQYKVRKFIKFCIAPDNFDYKEVINNEYNLYRPFPHIPEEGIWGHTERFLKHVFGKQYEMALDYLQLLYTQPKQILPVIVLVSKERETGKTTFINWLNKIFGLNAVKVSPEMLTDKFNAPYATKNVILVDETVINKKESVETIKELVTSRSQFVNEKHLRRVEVPFYGHIIMATNKERDFMHIDREEVRFWIVKVGKPQKFIFDMLEKLSSEIPFFLYYLKSRELSHDFLSRHYFSDQELNTWEREVVKEESKTGLFKDLCQYLEADFLELGITELLARPKDIKERYFNNDNRVSLNYISKVLKEEFGLNPEEQQRFWLAWPDSYNSDGAEQSTEKNGCPFKIQLNDIILHHQIIRS